MISRFMFHTLIVLTTVLTLSAPFVALAQQNPTQTAVTQDANGLNLEIKAAAERDARKDLNKNSGFLVSGSALAGCIIGALVGCLVGSSFPDTSGYSSMTWTIPDGMIAGTLIGGIIGGTVGCLVPLSLASRSQSNLQPKRFLGKSPEYVESYTNTYKLKALSLQAK